VRERFPESLFQHPVRIASAEMPAPRNRTIAIFAAFATYLFWLEYLPPFTRVHLYSDIEGFHWPLFVAAFEAILQGRLPLWDASIYCGLPFAGNVNTALFYPPTWLLFLASLPGKHVLFKTLETWVFLHAWLAFFLCYLWLRNRSLSTLASVLGAAVFAFGGYMVSQNNHTGVVTGFSWMPLAWLGIDESLQARSWRPMWKVVAASALCFLAGYAPSFSAFAVITVVYAAARSWRAGIAATVAIGASLAVAAIELLPAAEAAAFKTFDPKYGPGISGPLFYFHFLVPDWVGIAFSSPYAYLYLGVPALFGILWLVKRPDRASLAVLAACALFMTNPFNLIGMVIAKNRLLVQVFHSFQFFPPAVLAFAFLAANGIDGFLQSAKGKRAAWAGRKEFAFGTAALLVAWSAYRLWMWPRPIAGWRSVAETGVMLALFIAGLCVVRQGRTWAAILLCAAVFVDYKICGTSRPFSAKPGDEDTNYRRGTFSGVNAEAYETMLKHRHYRVAVDEIHPTDLRRYGLATPQGFDALLSVQYKDLIERYEPFRTNRLFDIPPLDEELLQLTGVRYFITRDGARFQRDVESDRNFRLVGQRDFAQVYEYKKALPPWRSNSGGDVTPVRWEPELREFQVNARAAGRFALAEQFYPGWEASIDGVSVPILEWRGAFQAIAVPQGGHIVRFEYRPDSVRIGAWISVLSVVSIGVWLRRQKR
jgi:hypothetical protein